MTDSLTALTAAASLNLPAYASLLIAHGATLSGCGVAAAAAANGHTEMLHYLLVQGADVNELGVRDFGDRRKAADEGAPLHKAAARGDLQMVGMLLEMGAKVDIRDMLFRTPIDRAREEGKWEVVAFLEQFGR